MEFWPQWMLIVISIINLVVAATSWERQGGKRNLCAEIIGVLILYSLLIAGGFFDGMFN